MQNAPDNNGSDTGIGNQHSDTGVSTNNSEDSGIDAAFAKHLDIAIEAQDGKPEAPTEGGDKNAGSTETGTEAKSTEQQSKDSGSSTGNAPAQDKSKNPEVAEAARTLAKAKDLTLKDGTVVRGGAERRFYEQRETARQEAAHERRMREELQTKYQEIEGKYKTLDETSKALHGMDARAVKIGAQIVTDLQRDPVGTMKKLLAETVAQGYNIEDIGAGIDAAAIKQMLDERIPANQQREPTEQELIADATAEVNQFYGRFPDARPHDALIAQVMRDHPALPLESVYFQLKNSFAEKGFDWNLSLEENLKSAVAHDNSAGQNQNNQQQTNQQQPLPNGRGSSDEEFKLNDRASAHQDLDTSDIVRQAMRENGLKI